MPARRKKLVKVFRVCALLLGLVVLACGLVVWQVYSYGNRSYSGNADAAVVLGAAVRGDQLLPVFRDRVDHAVSLFHAGRVRMLILTGGTAEYAEFAESDIARAYALRQGVPASQILIETKSHNTYQNLYYAAAEARPAGIHSFIVVSDPNHLRRALSMANDLGLSAEPSPVPNSRLNSGIFLLAESWRFAFYRFKRLFSPDGGELKMKGH